jgi:hypothetical protein
MTQPLAAEHAYASIQAVCREALARTKSNQHALYVNGLHLLDWADLIYEITEELVHGTNATLQKCARNLLIDATAYAYACLCESPPFFSLAIQSLIRSTTTLRDVVMAEAKDIAESKYEPGNVMDLTDRADEQVGFGLVPPSTTAQSQSHLTPYVQQTFAQQLQEAQQRRAQWQAAAPQLSPAQQRSAAIARGNKPFL